MIIIIIIINHQSSIINHQSSIINHQSSIINQIINHRNLYLRLTNRNQYK